MGSQPRVIKATESGGRLPAFNPVDTLAETKQRVEQARSEIESYQDDVKRQASALLEKSRQEGFQKGFAEGLAKGEADAKAAHEAKVRSEVSGRLASLGEALRTAAAQLAEKRDHWLSEWEKRCLHLACAIASRIVRRQVAIDRQTVQRIVTETLSLVGQCPEVTLFLHPGDAQSMGNQDQPWGATARTIGEIKIVADASIHPGGCRLETRFGSIDADLNTQLARIERELAGDDDANA